MGFKAFRLDSSNINAWDADFDTLEDALFEAVESIKAGRTADDVLYELLLKFGLDLSIDVASRDVAGEEVAIIGKGALVACLSHNITIELVEGVVRFKQELQPEVTRVVLLDAGFADDVAKTNAIQTLRLAGIDDVHTV